MNEGFGSVLSLLFILIMFCLILAMAYYASKLIGKAYSGQGTGGQHIQMLDRAVLGRDKEILLVRCADKTLLVGVTAQHIQTLCELDGERLPELSQAPVTTSFLQAFQNAVKQQTPFGKQREESNDER